MRSVTTVVNNGITLSSPASDNPLYIFETGTINSATNGFAVYGVSTFPWTITNDGLIAGQGANSNGVVFYGGGYLLNDWFQTITDDGRIYGGLHGVFGSYDQVTVKNGNLIVAEGSNGVAVDLTAGGTIFNATGTIAGRGASSTGVVLDHGGYISNTNGTHVYEVNGKGYEEYRQGIISGAVDGVLGTLGTVILVNNGQIFASASEGIGVDLAAGGTVTQNGMFGLISGGADGIEVGGARGGIYSRGTIEADAAGGLAVYLRAGGSVANYGGTLTGQASGLQVAGSAGTVTGDGKIIGTGAFSNGVVLYAGGSVTNTHNGTKGYISGVVHGIFAGYDPATITNYAAISGTGSTGIGIDLAAGGIVNNDANYDKVLYQSTIYGKSIGIEIAGGLGIVANYGTITGANGAGVELAGGSTVDNAGLIEGRIGVSIAGGPGTVTNTGTIIGTAGTAVVFGVSGSRLIDDPNAVFGGLVVGGGTDSTLELAEGAGIGTLAGLGTSFVDFSMVIVDAHASWEVAGDGSNYQFINDGTILVSNGIASSGETLVFGMVGEDTGDAGVIEVGNGGSAEFAGSVDAGQTVIFEGATGTLVLDDQDSFSAFIQGFTAGDTIMIDGMAATRLVYSKGTLRVVDSGQTLAALTFSGAYRKKDFHLGSDGNGDTVITIADPQPASYRWSAAASFEGFGGAAIDGLWTLRS